MNAVISLSRLRALLKAQVKVRPHTRQGRFVGSYSYTKASPHDKPVLAAGSYDHLPDSAKQPHNTEHEVYAAAEAVDDHHRKWLHGVAKDLGATVRDKHIGRDDPQEPGRPHIVIGKLKGHARAREKVASDYHGNWNRLNDVVRSSVAVDHAHELPGVIAHLQRHGLRLASKPKDRFANPTDAWYRDIMMRVHHPNGHVGEMQVHLKGMLDAKDKAHKHYETLRNIEATTNSTRKITPDQVDQWNHARKESRKIYHKAWKAAGGTGGTGGDVGKTRHYQMGDGYLATRKPGELPVRHHPGGHQTVVHDAFKFDHDAQPITPEHFHKIKAELT